MSKNFIERDISWLSFNRRVLFQTMRLGVTSLIERMKFLGITSSNLDEFLMVRVSDASFNNIELYRKLWKDVKAFKRAQEKIFDTHIKELSNDHNTILSKYKDLSDAHKDEVKDIFKTIYPLLVPLIHNTNIEFPLIHSKELCILVSFDSGEIGMIPIGRIPRMYRLSDSGKKKVYITSEEIIYPFIQKELFVDTNIKYKTTFRILREASITVDADTNTFIVDRMKNVLRLRETSKPIIMEIGDKSIPNNTLVQLCDALEIEKSKVYKANTILDYRFLIGKPFAIDGNYEEFTEYIPKKLLKRMDMFEAIDREDIILHHPFDSFEPVVRFISDAADDPDVVSIRQTLYRVSSESSPIIEALCRASARGKDVNVLLEIKARFDEEQNIYLIDKLKESGCKVICGIEEYKTHAKFALVVKKKKKGGFKCYAHVGTGNYNDKTSSVYTDLSLFTQDNKICTDLITVFNILSGKSNPVDKVEKIKFAPFNIRSSIYRLIDREIKNVKKGGKGMVIIKVNSISDEEMVNKIYEASEAGVKFNIICRGICSIKPINKNIMIKSIVGRFLEHSRVYYFYNNSNHELYISSADLLTRNLDRRVEIMVPVTSKKCKNQVYRILSTYLLDEVNSFIMSKNGKFYSPKNKGIDSHQTFIDEVIRHDKITKKEFKIAR